MRSVQVLNKARDPDQDVLGEGKRDGRTSRGGPLRLRFSTAEEGLAAPRHESPTPSPSPRPGEPVGGPLQDASIPIEPELSTAET